MDKQRSFIFVIAGIVLVAAIYFTVKHNTVPPAPTEITWTDFTAGSASAKTNNKKILIDVYTDWCTWCKTMEKNTYSNPEIIQYVHEHFIPVKLNAESKQVRTVQGSQVSDEELATAYGVKGYPTTVFIAADGRPITSIDGYVEPVEFKSVLRFIAEEKYLSMSFEDFKKSGM